MKFREIKIPAGLNDVLRDEIEKGNLTSGVWVDIVEGKLARLCNGTAVPVSSGTMALKIALVGAGVEPGSRVLIPDITFIACASVVVELGATPVYAEVDTEKYLIEQAQQCDVIMPVRLAGEEVPEWVFNQGVPVVVDSAHSMAPHDPRAFATCYSFHPSKIISGIEGGAIVTNEVGFAAAARRMRLFGFAEGSRTAQNWGYKGNMTNVSACLISFNLAQIQANLARRAFIRDLYNGVFGLKKQGLGYYMVTVDDPDAVCREIPAIRHYVKPLSGHIGYVPQNPKAQWVADHLVTIPMNEHLTDNDVDIVCGIVKKRLIAYQESHGARH